MKVGELREKLAKLKKEELIKVASEFYKLIPKAKKEDYDVDSFLESPLKTKKKSSSKTKLSLFELDIDIRTFIEHAKEGYYYQSNNVISKKERPKWRFKVKNWYKELLNRKREDVDLEKQAELLSDLYELLCESCHYINFSGDNPFRSIGITQWDFYDSVIGLLQEAKGKSNTIKKSIKLIVDNPLDQNTLYSSLMMVLIKTYEISDLKYAGIDCVKKLIVENDNAPRTKSNTWGFSNNRDFQKKRKNNNLTELGLRLYLSLVETEEGIGFYYKRYQESSEEVKLYILIRVLFNYEKKEQIVIEIEKAMSQGVKPRQNLIDLMNKIKKTGKLPQYMR